MVAIDLHWFPIVCSTAGKDSTGYRPSIHPAWGPSREEWRAVCTAWSLDLEGKLVTSVTLVWDLKFAEQTHKTKTVLYKKRHIPVNQTACTGEKRSLLVRSYWEVIRMEKWWESLRKAKRFSEFRNKNLLIRGALTTSREKELFLFGDFCAKTSAQQLLFEEFY